MKENAFIAIEGNIGAGKTTLAHRLATKLNGRLVLEEFEENSFLKGFYQDPQRYAFSAEMSFLADRFHQLSEVQAVQDIFMPAIIADYSPHKSLIFAQNNLNEAEFQLYRQFWEMSLGRLRRPELIVFLQRSLASLKANIALRGRSYEESIQDDYLRGLGEKYYHFLRGQNRSKILEINSEGYDFLKSEADLNWLIEQIEQKLIAS